MAGLEGGLCLHCPAQGLRLGPWRCKINIDYNNSSMARVNFLASGEVMLPKCFTTLPSLSNKYLLKFQAGSSVASASALNSGLAFSPLTEVGANMVKVTPKLTKQMLAASSSSLAS